LKPAVGAVANTRHHRGGVLGEQWRGRQPVVAVAVPERAVAVGRRPLVAVAVPVQAVAVGRRPVVAVAVPGRKKGRCKQQEAELTTTTTRVTK
jgi:hypothetical protein